MKYVLAAVAGLVGINYVMSEPAIYENVLQNKELLGALVLTLIAKPLLKRIFE
ncbi:hypothetical protein [Kangiella sediminilitoris]|uniref:Uncharacterized protein n=1 Tax=Kangiella sediminilitoris TaxID=1144748 RepID=A0A1B3B944_9GAMM|nr:hypothetical protein [Kangiella sediminilitoris]AOE49322.1 hypothetical protein KS2013_598 [Kangiella sediminilitoris]